MRINSFIIIITLLCTSCSGNKYRLWDKDITEPKGPEIPDYSISDSTTKFSRDIIYLRPFEDLSATQFINFWENGNCMISGVYENLNLDSTCCLKSGYRGKYEISADTLKAEFFVGGNPANEYLMCRYIISTDSMKFIDVRLRTPGKNKWKTHKWMQERHNRNLIKMPNQKPNPINWNAIW
jgi:hypothetical protein